MELDVTQPKKEKKKKTVKNSTAMSPDRPRREQFHVGTIFFLLNCISQLCRRRKRHLLLDDRLVRVKGLDVNINGILLC